MTNYRPSRASIMQFTPDPSGAFEVVFKYEVDHQTKETWTYPVIGWAVLRGAEDRDPGDRLDDWQYDTGLEPVVLDDEGYARTALSIRREAEDNPGHVLGAIRRKP